MAAILKFNDFSDSYIKIDAVPGKSIAECVSVEKWENYVVVVNGKKESENYIIQEYDGIIIRSIPKGMTAAAIFLGVVAFGAAIYSGIKSYQLQKQAEAAKRELDKIRNATKDDITNLPYLAGASNTIATGRTQPYVIGRHLFTPYILNGGNNYKGFHTISGAYGKDSFYNVVLEGGFNKQVIESVYCDDIKAASLLTHPAVPQENTALNPRFYFNSDSAFASDDSYIEISQDGQGFENDVFNQKIIEQEVSDQLKKSNAEDYEDLYYTLEKNAKACEIEIMFNGLYKMDPEGTKSAREVTVIPEYSLDYAEKTAEGNGANATWTSFSFLQYSTQQTSVSEQKGYYWCMGSESYAKNHWDEWVFKGGEDIRNENGVKFSYEQNGFQGTSITAIIKNVTETISGETLSNTFNYNKQSQIRFSATKNFSFTDCFTLEDGEYKQREYPITIRLRCTTPKVSSGSEVSDCYVEWVHSVCYDIERSKAAQSLIDESLIGENEALRSTLIGIHVKATQSNQDKIKKINVITNGVAPTPTYDPQTQTYTWNLSNKVMTSNPASWIIEVLTSDTHKASKVLAEEIDFQTFGVLWAYCENHGIEVNKVLTNSQKKAEVLRLICSVCHAALYQNIYGKIAVAFDSVKENAIALLNEQNIVSFAFEKNIALEVDGIRAMYIDSGSRFQENSFLEFYDENTVYDENTILREVSLDGITGMEQAHRQAYYLMANEKLRPLKATIQIGREGIYFTPFSKILLQHPALKTGLGNAVIKRTIIENGNIVGCELYDAIGLNGNYNFSSVIQCVSGDNVTLIGRSLKVLVTDKLELSDGTNLELSDGTELILRRRPISSDNVEYTKELYFAQPISTSAAVIPHPGDVLSYGYELETVTREFTVSAIKPNGTQGYTLECVDYNGAIFDFDTRRIPEYSPIVTERRGSGKQVPSEVPDSPTFEQTKSMIQTIAENMIEQSTVTPARYLGKSASYPASPSNGDWFTASSSDYGLTKGKVYKYTNGSWTALTETDSANSQYFMTALNDILSVVPNANGYFSAIFANSLMANDIYGKTLKAVSVYHDSTSSGEEVRINYTKADGSSGSDYARIVDKGDYLYFGKDYGSQNASHTSSYTKISKQGLLEADNAVIHGAIYASAGEFTGKVHAGSGEIDKDCIVKGFVGNEVLIKDFGYVYFYDDGSSGSTSSPPDMPIIRKSSNIYAVRKISTGHYLVHFNDISDLVYNIGEHVFARSDFDIDVIRLRGSSQRDGTEGHYYEKMVNQILAVTYPAVESGGNWVSPDGHSFNMTGEDYLYYFQGRYVVGLATLNNNEDEFVNCRGGCRVIFRATHV